MVEKFFDDMTYDEWSSKQDKNSLEYHIIEEIHKVYSNWNFEDIKTFAPIFMSSHMKIVQDIQKDDITLNMQDIEKRAMNYISAGINGNKIHIHVFGNKEPCDDYRILSKWNVGLCKVMDILINGAKYKHEDERGHASVNSFKFNGYAYGFRSEMELDRDIKEIVELNRERFGTKSDFFKELIFKGVAILSIINKGILGERADKILKDVARFERRGKEIDLQNILKDIDDFFEEKYEILKDIEHNEKGISSFRDKVVKYITDTLTLKCDDDEMARIVKKIQDNRELSRILDSLEKHDLVSKEYIDSILDKGIVMPHFKTFDTDDLTNNS